MYLQRVACRAKDQWTSPACPRRRRRQLDKVGVEEGKNVHRLGVAEAGVVLDQANAVDDSDKAAIENAHGKASRYLVAVPRSLAR